MVWVLGIYKSNSPIRFVRVKNRKASTLLSVLQKYVKSGSTIWTDEFTSYKSLSSHGYVHHSVNHKENYVDPDTGTHTQGIGRAWVDAKQWYKSSRGSRALLQSHLSEAACSKLRADDKKQNKLFNYFLNDLRECYVVW